MQRDPEDKAGNGANGNGKNPHLKRLGEAAAAEAAREKVFDKARDTLWLAYDAKRTLERELGAAPITESGPVFPAGAERRFARVSAQCEAADEEFQRASEALRKARGELYRVQRAAEQWDLTERYLADQAAQEAALTPEERRRREIRDLLDKERAVPR